MKKRDRMPNGWACILLVSMLFLWACSQTIEPETSHESTIREPAMSGERDLPAIDAAAPSVFETASFGLG